MTAISAGRRILTVTAGHGDRGLQQECAAEADGALSEKAEAVFTRRRDTWSSGDIIVYFWSRRRLSQIFLDAARDDPECAVR